MPGTRLIEPGPLPPAGVSPRTEETVAGRAEGHGAHGGIPAHRGSGPPPNPEACSRPHPVESSDQGPPGIARVLNGSSSRHGASASSFGRPHPGTPLSRIPHPEPATSASMSPHMISEDPGNDERYPDDEARSGASSSSRHHRCRINSLGSSPSDTPWVPDSPDPPQIPEPR